MLFVKYAKLSNKPTDGEESLGRGLAIYKKMIQIQGNDIGRWNNPDDGANFWFKSPAPGLAVGHTEIASR